jgi:tetratricopeptide (TPR) repeat protein
MPLWGESSQDIARHHAETGIKLHAKGDLEGALRHWTRALEIIPEYPTLHLHRGWAYYQAGNYPLALADLDRAAELDPAFFQVYENRGWVRIRSDDLDGALEDFSRLVTAQPDAPRGYALRGMARARAGDPDRGLDDCSFSVEIDSRCVEGYLHRADLQIRRNALKEAAADAARILTFDRKNVSVPGLQGRLALLESRPQEAGEHFERSLRADGIGGWCRYGLAVSAILLRRWKLAREEFERTLPQACWDAQLRGYTHLRLWALDHRLGDGVDADERLDGYLKSRPRNPRGDWVARLADFLRGRLSEADLRAAASAAHPGLRQERGSQVEYHVGLRRQISGDAAGARQAFQACVDADRRDYFEWILARAELEAP